ERATPAFDTLIYIYKDQLNDGKLWYNHFEISYHHLLKRSHRDFLHRWGQTFDFELFNTPYITNFRGKLWAVRSTLYFPGLFKHHFFYQRVAYQESMQGVETDLYTFRNQIPKPRGHSYPADEKFLSFSVNYAMPLWYPDIAIGPLVNIQRIKANFFYDFGKGSGHQYFYRSNSNNVYYSTTDATYHSVGAETTVDFNVLRFLPKFEVGVRTSYRFENDFNRSGLVVEFLIGNIGF
ncbi:MAG: hypothetical protein ACOYXT_28220, partial [Bacteroidota bacterium]